MSESAATATAGESTGTESTTAPEGGEGGIESQVKAMSERLDTALAALPKQEQTETETAVDSNDLLDLLLGPDEDGEPTTTETTPPAPAAQAQADTPEAQAQARAEAVLDQYVQNRIEQAFEQRLNPVIDSVETRFRQADLAALADKYPELKTKEGVEAARARLTPYVDRYGEGVLTDPGLVETVLIAERAAKTAAEQTTASQAREEGAALETGAGASGDGEKSAAEQEIEAIMTAGGPRSAFFGGG